MYIHDDADTAEVVQSAVAAVKEAARHIGKADRGIGAGQIARVEDAIKELQRALDLKKGAARAARA